MGFGVFLLTLCSCVMALAQPTIDPCATSTYDVTVENGTHLTTDPAWDHKTILLKGVVTFDHDVTMSNCSLVMGKDATIAITANNSFNSLECNIVGCTNTGGPWTAIIVQAKASVQFLYTNISGGRLGLNFRPGFKQEKTNILGCNFGNMYACIWVGNPYAHGAAPIEFFPNIFAGNTFKPNLGSVGEYGFNSYGIVLFDCTGCIGCTGSNTYIGIYSYNSNLIVKNQFFTNMTEIFNPSAQSGNGILTQRSYLSVDGCTFSYGYRNGIYATDLNKGLEVTNSTFTQNKNYGIYTENNAISAYTRIIGNTFNLDHDGYANTIGHGEDGAIKHERCFSANVTGSHNRISNNKISVSSTKNKPITMINVTAPNGGADLFYIDKNEISVTSRYSQLDGIYVKDNSDQLKIEANNLFYDVEAINGISHTLAIAVDHVAGKNNTLSGNTIRSKFYKNHPHVEGRSPVKCGIHIDESPRFQLCGDNVDKTLRGVHFSGNLSFCDFADCTIGEHQDGILARQQFGSTTTILGPQRWHRNKWIGPEYHHQAATRDDGPTTAFRVDDTAPNGDPSHLPPSFTALWFVPVEAGPTTSLCPIPATQIVPTDVDTAIASHNFPFASPVEAWDQKRELLGYLMSNPDMMPTGSVFANFYNEEYNGSAWKYAQGDYLYKNAFFAASNLESEIESLQNQLSAKMVQIGELNRLQSIDPNTIDPTIKQQQDVRSAEAKALYTTLNTKTSSASSLVAAALLTAKNWNTALPASTIYEKNRKALYKYYFKKAAGDSLTVIDQVKIRSIVQQCPTKGGKSVRKAASLLPTPESITYQNENAWDIWCPNPFGTNPNDRSVLQEYIQIVPNPASDYFEVWIPTSMQGGRWSLTDMSGRLMRQGAIANEEKFRVPIAHEWATGLYFVTLFSPLGLPVTQKLAITH